ncbi:hypothetical protein [Burkholderia glumae]|uniref:Uncharacterized protein n=1 Tax=Burkholderia glumae TaxID=337 RepID=A0AAP9Y4V2_BURGL|nr:hypothetical protein [Burkholderia glumae]AJY62343.1 hypothetical protein KS03_5858 [Burkholderia glumae LMG 2196 = ATCC 33617]PNK93209.1 hypothetical protein CEQ24_030085 [Burkholderia glumae]QPQ94671.1 hypothetical protein I6H06_29085 [Burkholderia glumae]QQM89487.1 hypothetical protein I6G78_01095 [Burkholderia glumae]UVS88716.1 hypothetical protein EFP17_02190 [Burkholderia glumae]
MAADVQPVNWWVVVASSAVIGAVVNNGISLWTRHRDRLREAAALRDRQAYAQLDVARALEAFAQRASAYLLDLQVATGLAAVGQGDPFKRVDQVRLGFEFEPEPVWTDLPIQLVADVRELPVAFAVSQDGIRAIFAGQTRHAGFYELEAHQTMHYGLLAAQLASRIRGDIGVAPSALVADYVRHFELAIDLVRQAYRQAETRPLVDPALEARFRRELAAQSPSGEAGPPHDVSSAVAARRARETCRSATERPRPPQPRP